MKTTLKITSKGQVTFRKEVMDKLGVKPGDKITIELVGPGRMEVRPAGIGGTLEQFIGCLKQPGSKALSVEEMTEIARRSWAGER